MELAPPDLLDFFSTPVFTHADGSRLCVDRSSRFSSSCVGAASAGASSSVGGAVEAAEWAQSNESFDFTSHLASRPDRHDNFGALEDDSAWSTLRSCGVESGGGGEVDRPSFNAAHRVAPDSWAYQAGKSIDTIGDRMHNAVGHAMHAIDALDERHGVTARIREMDQRHGVTRRLDHFASNFTAHADRISTNVAELHVGDKVKQSVSAVRQRLHARRQASATAPHPARATRGKYITFGAEDRILRSGEENSGSEGELASPIRGRSSSMPTINAAAAAAAVSAKAANAAAAFSTRDTLFYQSHASRPPAPAPAPPPIPPPPALPVSNAFGFSVAPLRTDDLYETELEYSEGLLPDDDHGSARGFRRNIDTPLSSTRSISSADSQSHSREHSLSFSALRFDEIALSPCHTNLTSTATSANRHAADDDLFAHTTFFAADPADSLPDALPPTRAPSLVRQNGVYLDSTSRSFSMPIDERERYHRQLQRQVAQRDCDYRATARGHLIPPMTIDPESDELP